MNPGAVSAGVVVVRDVAKVPEEEDSLSLVVKKQEKALKRLEEKHGAGEMMAG